MQVYHEPTPPVYRVTPGMWRNQQPPTQFKLRTCISGTRGLEAIIEDLAAELQRPNISSQTVKDAGLLITLVSYLYYEPLLNVRTALGRWNVPEAWRLLLLDYTTALDNLNVCLHHALELAELRFTEHPATEATVQRVHEFSTSQNDLPFDIPAFSPLELLLRVVTTRQRWVNHEALFRAYRDLKVRGAFERGNCMPQSGFACLGMTTNGHQIGVLGFSAEYWTGYDEMHTFVRLIHKSRCHTFDGIQLRNIVRWSDTLCNRFDEEETPLSLIATPPGYFTHEDDIASPFHCDSFKPRDRCIRCQALFKYKVTQCVRDLEARMNRANINRRPNQNWSCAEVYAHFCCQQLSENGHSPCEMR